MEAWALTIGYTTEEKISPPPWPLTVQKSSRRDGAPCEPLALARQGVDMVQFCSDLVQELKLLCNLGILIGLGYI